MPHNALLICPHEKIVKINLGVKLNRWIDTHMGKHMQCILTYSADFAVICELTSYESLPSIEQQSQHAV